MENSIHENDRIKLRVCPRCGNLYYLPPAISRTDNRTEICSACGFDEALRWYYQKEQGLEFTDRGWANEQ